MAIGAGSVTGGFRVCKSVCERHARRRREWRCDYPHAHAHEHATSCTLAPTAITFQEYAPVILGAPLPAYAGYNAALDPGVSPSFAIAAYRYGHSGINSIYLCLEADGTECSIGHLILRDVYFRPAYLNFTSIVQARVCGG